MSNEREYWHANDTDTLYQFLHATDGKVWKTTTSVWETFAEANWDGYALSLTRNPAGSRRYTGDMPSVDDGWYKLTTWEQSGGSPDDADDLLRTEWVWWDGTAGELRPHPETGDSYAELTDDDYGLDQLVRSTTPANTLDVSAAGNVGPDFNNIEQATGATTLSNITVPTVTEVTNKTGYELNGTGVYAIWNALTSSMNVAGSIGKLIKDYLDQAVSTITSASAADVWDYAKGDCDTADSIGEHLAGLSIDASGRVDIGKWLGTAVSLDGGLPEVTAAEITGAAATITTAEIIWNPDAVGERDVYSVQWAQNGVPVAVADISSPTIQVSAWAAADAAAAELIAETAMEVDSTHDLLRYVATGAQRNTENALLRIAVQATIDGTEFTRVVCDQRDM